jgi:hypothetical protein
MVSFPKISPNLLLGVGGLIAVAVVVNQVRKAGGDLQNALSGIKFPEFPDVNFPDINFPSIFVDGTTTDSSSIRKDNPDESDLNFENKTPSEGLLTTEEREKCQCGVSIFQDANGNVTEKCLVCQDGSNSQTTCGTGTFEDPSTGKCIPIPKDENIFIPASGSALPKDSEIISKDVIDGVKTTDKVSTAIQQPEPTIISELPTEQQFEVFVAEGSNVAGGIIRENSIDTLTEVIKYFPELTASQARDFLDATGGKIVPSQVEQGLIDPDIKNIVGGVVGGSQDQAIPVSQTPTEILSIRESENLKASIFTCENFGLNCELTKAMMG